MEFNTWEKRKKEIIIEYFRNNDLKIDMRKHSDKINLDTMIFNKIHVEYLWNSKKYKKPHYQNLLNILEPEYEKIKRLKILNNKDNKTQNEWNELFELAGNKKTKAVDHTSTVCLIQTNETDRKCQEWCICKCHGKDK